jgi:osmotically-inducible protein OsmY
MLPLLFGGAMKSDDELRADVVDELQSEPAIRHSRIYVRARNGTVTLSGQVRSFAEKRAADSVIGRVTGVKEFETQINICRPVADDAS